MCALHSFLLGSIAEEGNDGADILLMTRVDDADDGEMCGVLVINHKSRVCIQIVEWEILTAFC